MRWDLFAIAGVIVVLAVARLTRGSDPDRLRFEVEGALAYGYGFTDGRSETIIRDLTRDHPQVETLVFVNMPGTRDVTSNYRLARSIRRVGLDTELLPQSRIASGAVDLFLAGVNRTVACGAQVGVHAWGSSGFDAQDAVWDNHRSYSRDFLSDMGIAPDFYDFRTNAAGSEAMHWMTEHEIDQWAVATEPRNCSS